MVEVGRKTGEFNRGAVPISSPIHHAFNSEPFTTVLLTYPADRNELFPIRPRTRRRHSSCI